MQRIVGRRGALGIALVVSTAILSGCYTCVRCGTLPGKVADDEQKDLARELEATVRFFAEDIGPRSYLEPAALDAAATEIERRLSRIAEGKSYAKVEALPIYPSSTLYRNVVLTLSGSEWPRDVVVVGAHYDSDAFESRGVNPGADDNATGVAALLVLAERFAEERPKRTMHFVAFTNEEEPFFKTHEMGSLIYARDLKTKRKGDVVAMVSLEMLGYFTDVPGSQKLGPPLPGRGNFLAFVSNWPSASLTRRMSDLFCASTSFPTQLVVGPRWAPGIGWSDHWSFWKEGVPAFMVTDTALQRNYCYHEGCDVADRLDFRKMAIVVDGIEVVLRFLSGAPDLD